jgi:hypothetical protein
MIKSDRLIKLQPLGQMAQLSTEFKIWYTSQVANEMDCSINLINEIKFCPSGMFSIQLDEPMDAGHLAQLLVYVRHVRNDNIKTECFENNDNIKT